MRVKFFILFLIFFASISEAREQANLIRTEFKGSKWTGFCYPIDEDTFPEGYGECVVQSNLTFEGLFNSQDGYCRFESEHLACLKRISHIKIENNFVVDGDRYVYILLRKYSGACSILALNDESNAEDIALLKNALHLIYTQYADGNSWPMPTKKLQKIWIAKFGTELHFTNEQRLFLFNTWYKYLKNNTEHQKRWLPRNPQLGMNELDEGLFFIAEKTFLGLL